VVEVVEGMLKVAAEVVAALDGRIILL